MTDRELMQQALEAWDTGDLRVLGPRMAALRERLARQEQEPYAWADAGSNRCSRTYRPDWIGPIPLYTAPQPAQQPLTDEMIDRIYTGVRAVHHDVDCYTLARAIEAAHGITGEKKLTFLQAKWNTCKRGLKNLKR